MTTPEVTGSEPASGDAPLLVVNAPDELSHAMVEAGVVRRVLGRRSAFAVVNMTIGLGGSLVALFQTPTALRDFAKFVRTWAGSKQTTVLLHLEQGPSGTTITISDKLDDNTTAALIQRALAATRLQAEPDGTPTVTHADQPAEVERRDQGTDVP
jgi:hypothetical protein